MEIVPYANWEFGYHVCAHNQLLYGTSVKLHLNHTDAVVQYNSQFSVVVSCFGRIIYFPPTQSFERILYLWLFILMFGSFTSTV